MLSTKLKNIKFYLNQSKFINNNTRIKKREIILTCMIILLCVGLIIARFFYNGNRWLTPNEITSSLYINNLYLNLSYLFIGFSIPIVGASMQIITQNKLAEPTTLGFYPIIYMGILLSQLSLNSNATSYIFSILLSSTVILINFIIVKGNPTNNTFKSVLAGFCINAITTGLNYLIINYSFATGNPLAWLSGNIGVLTFNRLVISSSIAIFFTIIILLLSSYLNIINKNYLLAKVLGIKINLIYWIIAICSIMVTISSVLLIGGVILLGIIVPHIIRIILKPNNVFNLFILSGIFGSTMLLSSWWLVELISYNFFVMLNINFLSSIFAIFVFVYLLKTNKG